MSFKDFLNSLDESIRPSVKSNIDIMLHKGMHPDEILAALKSYHSQPHHNLTHRQAQIHFNPVFGNWLPS